MCGIIGRIGGADTLPELLSGLEKLEYRGYDSAGVAVQDGRRLRVCKREGKISDLKSQLDAEMPAGTVAIGHTRWSTHGPPTDANAHPHTDCTGRIAVVHNGIIENHSALRSELAQMGHSFESDTDTEVVPHLIEAELAATDSPEAAFRAAIDRLEGSYALAVLFEAEETVYATRAGSPLVVGLDGATQFLASDVPAFLDFTDRVLYLEDGDVAILAGDQYEVTDQAGQPVTRPVETVSWMADDVEKSGYDHFMFKEIDEQPMALTQTLEGRTTRTDGRVTVDALEEGTFDGIDTVQFVGCGTSYHAALAGAGLLSKRGVEARAVLASEYATSPPPIDETTLVVGVTQSGETADTLASLRVAAEAGAQTLALTNVVGSTAARECEETVLIRAGPEIGVAATKTFSSQVGLLCLLAERIAEAVTESPHSTTQHDTALLDALDTLPSDVQTVLDGTNARTVAERYAQHSAFFFIGRGACYPVALEGALKFKEITYEHAEGFAAGELKHGPLALVTEETPVFALFGGDTDEKTLSNVHEVKARGAPVIAVGHPTNPAVREVADDLLEIPETHPEVASILANVQLQLVSYHVANLLSRSIDKPRNLAKSVTVE